MAMLVVVSSNAVDIIAILCFKKKESEWGDGKEAGGLKGGGGACGLYDRVRLRRVLWFKSIGARPPASLYLTLRGLEKTHLITLHGKEPLCLASLSWL